MSKNELTRFYDPVIIINQLKKCNFYVRLDLAEKSLNLGNLLTSNDIVFALLAFNIDILGAINSQDYGTFE